jgi:hypothetical protein
MWYFGKMILDNLDSDIDSNNHNSINFMREEQPDIGDTDVSEDEFKYLLK